VTTKGEDKMTLKTLLIIKAVVCLALGVPILVAPGFVYGLFGAELNEAGTFAAQEYAAAMLGIHSLLTWYSRNAEEYTSRRAIILDLVIYDSIGVVITLIAIYNGIFSALGWGIIVIYLFFAVGYGYFWFAKPATASRPSPA
jgi:hypothetical protein